MEQEQHKGQVADLVAETKDWKNSPRCFGVDEKDGERYKEQTLLKGIATIKDEYLALEKNKKNFLDEMFGHLVKTEVVSSDSFIWVYPPFAYLVLDTITYSNGNVKYYKVLADQKPVWIHSKDICLL